MMFFLLILILYGAPISLGIMILYWILSGMKHEKTARVIRKFLFIGLGIFIIGATFYNWWSTHHTVHFQLGNQYKIVLHAEEIESFLDARTDFSMEIEDKKSGKKREFEFHSDSGTEFEFLVSDANTHLIRITGFGHNSGQNYTVNMDKKRSIDVFEKGKSISKKLVPGYQIVDINQSDTTNDNEK